MPKRGVGFNAHKISILLDAVEEYLPIGQNDWEMVEQMHSCYYSQSGRTKESPKHKFIQLYHSNIPTGDPKCQDDVRQAKHLLEEIKKRSDLSDGEGGGDDADKGTGDNSEEEDKGVQTKQEDKDPMRRILNCMRLQHSHQLLQLLQLTTPSLCCHLLLSRSVGQVQNLLAVRKRPCCQERGSMMTSMTTMIFQ